MLDALLFATEQHDGRVLKMSIMLTRRDTWGSSPLELVVIRNIS